MKCPECQSSGELIIYCEVRTKVYVDRDGNVEDSEIEEGYTWDDSTDARCSKCGWDGTVKDLNDADEDEPEN